MAGILQVAMEKQDYRLAAHAIVYGLAKTTVEETRLNDQKKRSSTRKPER
jgi:hypothetical protein